LQGEIQLAALDAEPGSVEALMNKLERIRRFPLAKSVEARVVAVEGSNRRGTWIQQHPVMVSKNR